MTWKAWPINASAGAPSYDGSAFRQMESVWHTPHPSGLSRPLGATSGRAPFAWNVTLSTLVINIAAGSGVLDVETTVTTGAYRVSSDATDSTLSVTAAHASLDRVDGVYVQLDDTDVDGSTFRKALPVYVAGTAGSGTPPSGGSIPARSLRIATIAVPHTGAGSPTVTMEPLYTVAAGGTLPIANLAAVPASPYEGQRVWTMDTNLEWAYDGSAWKVQSPRTVRYTATPLASSSAGTFGVTGNVVVSAVPYDSIHTIIFGSYITQGTGADVSALTLTVDSTGTRICRGTGAWFEGVGGLILPVAAGVSHTYQTIITRISGSSTWTSTNDATLNYLDVAVSPA